MKIAIVTDSTVYLTPEERREWNIHVLPLSVIFGQESYREEQDLTTADFYEKVKNSEVFPTSSQPAVGETIELFRELSHHYDAIIPILLSSGISGTYQTVVTVAEELQDEVLIYPIDSGISCAPQARAVRLAAMMAKDEQYTAKEIVACVQQLVDRTTAYFIVDDLNNLQRGGRLSAGAALVGSMLKIKPILTFEDKKIVALEKIRTQQKAMKRIEQLFEEDTPAELLAYLRPNTLVKGGDYKIEDSGFYLRENLEKIISELNADRETEASQVAKVPRYFAEYIVHPTICLVKTLHFCPFPLRFFRYRLAHQSLLRRGA